MKKMEVNATVPAKDDKPELSATILVDAPETAKEGIEVVGDEPIITNALANWKITLQGNIRAGLKRGETQEQIQARLGGSKMGVAATATRLDPTQAYLALFASASPDKQKEMLEALQARAAS